MTQLEIIINRTLTYKNVKLARKVLVDNGVDPEEVDIVLQAVGYALLDVELQPLIAEAESK